MIESSRIVPASFVCPLTRKLMEDPVMDQCAHTFERSAISEWLGRHDCCPISRKPTSQDDLVANHSLAERIDRWQWERDNPSMLRHLDDEWRIHDPSIEAGAVPYDDGMDIELARKHEQQQLRRARETKRRALTPIFMLLPQEEVVLKMGRLKDEAEKGRFRQHARHLFFSLLLIAGILAISYLLLSKLVFEDVEEGDAASAPGGIADDFL